MAGLTGLLAEAKALQRPAWQSWTPKLGIYARYSESNVEFVKKQGFTSIQLAVRTNLDPGMTEEQIDRVKNVMARSGLYTSSLGASMNHIDPDPEKRSHINSKFTRTIELAGKLGVPNIGTASGTMPGKPLGTQVEEIVRVYTETYFPACQKHNVRILWEPYPLGPNIATGPVGFEALFRAFGDSPHVGLQYDPSHLVWQMIDPIQCARDFVNKIYDVHLKDTEVMWPVLRRVGIAPPDGSRWWRYRLPGSGSMDWKAFFTVLMEAGYSGAMNIEHEDSLYYPNYEEGEFTESFKRGFLVAHSFLKQLIPEAGSRSTPVSEP
ncbi:MAG TPA: sugar phosphate isomerase/epimerase [Bryobacteraceae bacterium]|jgi:sugar phosphate isomerase/epimerase